MLASRQSMPTRSERLPDACFAMSAPAGSLSPPSSSLSLPRQPMPMPQPSIFQSGNSMSALRNSMRTPGGFIAGTLQQMILFHASASPARTSTAELANSMSEPGNSMLAPQNSTPEAANSASNRGNSTFQPAQSMSKASFSTTPVAHLLWIPRLFSPLFHASSEANETANHALQRTATGCHGSCFSRSGVFHSSRISTSLGLLSAGHPRSYRASPPRSLSLESFGDALRHLVTIRL